MFKVCDLLWQNKVGLSSWMFRTPHLEMKGLKFQTTLVVAVFFIYIFGLKCLSFSKWHFWNSRKKCVRWRRSFQSYTNQPVQPICWTRLHWHRILAVLTRAKCNYCIIYNSLSFSSFGMKIKLFIFVHFNMQVSTTISNHRKLGELEVF